MLKWEVNRYGKWHHAMSNAGHSFSSRSRLWLNLRIWWINRGG